MSGWTDERIELLKRLWGEGKSASEIARTLCDTTRNAVIAKVHRLGFKRNQCAVLDLRQRAATGIRRPYRARPAGHKVEAAAPRLKTFSIGTGECVFPITSPIQPLPPERDEAPGTATVLTIGSNMCKWPIGDPASPAFSFCGRRSRDDGPYCIAHAKIAYQPRKKGDPRTGNELARALRKFI